ncbi:MAG: DUF892 family protein [Verrucomicrobiales bacterium]|nr:DUF892 family protein [Verrucomicrobiales bacterium]
MITNLKDLYMHQIKDLYSAESQVLDALPQMIANAKDEELRTALSEHLDETRGQKDRLEEIFRNHGKQPEKEKCKAAEGIIEEGDELMKELIGDAADAGIIAAAQRFEHYEIAAYGTAKEYADSLGFDDDVDLLDKTLEEESDANELLTKLAVGRYFGMAEGLNEDAKAA